MVVLVAALLGGVLGGLQARRRGGNSKDIAQYAVAYGIAFSLLGMIVAVTLDRLVV
jgi:hypothetical protein